MDKTKKELQNEYKEREIIGGVYVIKNLRSGKLLLEAAADLRGSRNRFEFSQKTGSCVNLKLQKDWAEQGGKNFVLEVLEELKKGEEQTPAEFRAEIDLLKDLWREKLAGAGMY
ncbi:MAG: GIY-YIG nuclease family protein [Gracilibacteraceae bacterium]|jgi:hypothetical protein|nr:GIY-YIG nuclease family protein [Gracilibacteraceae bacterium]